ncbi:MAG TPA: ribonuclease III [Sphingomicrobium sp.]
MKADVAKFVRETLGYEPKDMRLFELALTHASSGKENYERLEFLGDRVLGHVIARTLYERNPNEPEGYLSRRYNVLVARETCAEIGRDLGVPSLVRLGKQAREDGASQSDNVVGDVVEALIGALVIDGGLEAAERFIARVWEPHLAGQRKAPKHPKSALQELAAARDCKSPVYEVVSRTGAHHQPKFTIRVSVPGLGEATAEGTSKQEAETDAAEALLAKLSDASQIRQA